MGKIIRLSEAELTRVIKRAVNDTKRRKKLREQPENFFNPEAMETGDAILTMVLTVIGLLGFAGSHYIKAMIDKLRKNGEDDKAEEVQKALDNVMSEKSSENEM